MPSAKRPSMMPPMTPAEALRDSARINRAVRLAVRDALAAMAPKSKATPKTKPTSSVKAKPGSRGSSRRKRAA